MTSIEESKQYPELPLFRSNNDKENGSMSTITQSEEFSNQEANIDVIYVNNDHKVKMNTSDSESDLVLEYGTEQTVEVEDEPPPLPIKKKSKQDNIFEEKVQFQITDGVYILENVSSLIFKRNVFLMLFRYLLYITFRFILLYLVTYSLTLYHLCIYMSRIILTLTG